MPRRVVILIGLGVVILAAGVLWFSRSADNNSLTSDISQEPLRTVWVEVLSPSVFEMDGDTKVREIKSGDEVAAGKEIQTGTGAFAVVHFPDGSVARVDGGTTFRVEDASFDESSDTSIIRIFLKTGRLWSKVLSVVSPASLWEVKTTNAVATVRGTAFGMWHVGVETGIVGSQDAVQVKARDPKTEKTLDQAMATVRPGKFVQIKDSDIETLKEKPEILAVRDVPETVASQAWVKRSQEADIVIDKKIEDLRSTGLNEADIRKTLRQSEADERQELQETPAPAAGQAPIKDNASKDKDTNPAVSGGDSAAIPQTLLIETGSSLNKVIEGDAILFKATLVFSDRQKRDVTNEVAWKVLGPIGQISRSGEFRAGLLGDTAEFGKGVGSVTASWKDRATGKTLEAHSTIFYVEAKAQEPVNNDRG